MTRKELMWDWQKVYRSLMRKLAENYPLRKPGKRWEVKIMMDLKEKRL
jgi:hypothetical protein